jgi:glycosyltransferase involved in cell wall biosynthesis
MSRTFRDTSMPARPRVLYFSRIDLPSPKANSIQSFQTCWELARLGADVRFVVRRLLGSRRDCFAHYGLPEHPRLRLLSLSLPVPGDFNAWRGLSFRFYLRAFLGRHRHEPTLLLTRDPAGLELLRAYAALPPHPEVTTLFEVHKLAFLTKASHQEERGRSLDDPRVQAKIEARRRLEAEIYGAVDGLVCTSENARRLLDEHFPQHAPARVVPNGSPGGELPLATGPLDDAARDLDVLYIGQLYAWKGIDGLVRAMAHLPTRRLTIVGGNDARDLERVRAAAAAAGVADRVSFAGQVPPAEVPGWLARARVGVVPLPERGFVEAAWFTSPLKLFELMRWRVPIVASDLPSVREIVQDGEHAVLVPPDDPAALARGIERLLADRELAAQLVRAAAERVLDYTWEARARSLLEFAATLRASRLSLGA